MNRKEEAIKMANDILNFVADYDYDSKTFAETICCGNRTLQRPAMNLFMDLVRQLAETSFDEQNGAAVALAKEIITIVDKHPLLIRDNHNKYICPRCGSIVSLRYNYCYECGKSLILTSAILSK